MVLAITITLSPLSIIKAQTQDALYIFRNDGTFNAFFYADIIRIGYSNIDTLGVEHDVVVVQEIEALDTLYRIPLSAIDSVAFVTPENKVKADVTVMTSQFTDYIVASDSVSWFRLSASTPESIVPKVGDKLLIQEPAPYLPDGFSGKVTNVSKAADGITVTTEAVDLLELFDRFVAKAAGTAQAPAEQARRAAGDDVWKTHLDVSYQTAEPIVLPALTGNFNLTASGGMGDNLSGSLDGVGTITYAFTPRINVRAFLYADPEQGIKYHQELRWSGDESFSYSIAGILTGHLDIPATIPAEAVKQMTKATLKEGGKELIKKLGDFDLALSFGVFVELQGSMNMSLTTQRTNARHVDVLNYEQRPTQLPGADLFHHLSSSKSDHDSVSCSGWAGKLTFNAGVYAKAAMEVSFKKRIMKRKWEVGVRLEGGIRLEEEPAVAIDAITETAYKETSRLYTLLNREDDVHLNLFANVQLYAKLGWLTPLHLKPEITTDHLGLYGIVPNISRIQWNIDKKKPWQGTLTSPVSRELLFDKPVGFAIFDDTGKQVADWWNPVSYRSPYAYAHYQNTFDCLEPGMYYTAYPQIQVYGKPILTDQSTEFTLGPAFINVDKEKKVLTDYDKRVLEVDEKINFRDVELLTNIANTEMEVPADAKWIFIHNWDKDEACVKLSIDNLPDDVDRREAVIRFTGRDSTGTKVLAEDSLVVRQLRPYIKATPSPVEFKKEGGTQTVVLETSLDELSAWIVPETNPGNFCSIKLEKGKDGQWTIAVTIAENKDADERTVSIVVDGQSLSGQKQQLIFYVNQEGTDSGTSEEDPTLPDTDILPGTPFDGLKYLNYDISISKKNGGNIWFDNNYSVGDSPIKATVDGRYIYVLMEKGSKESGDSAHVYLKIDNESIDKNIVGGRLYFFEEGPNFRRTISMTLKKIPNWFHNKRKIDYRVNDMSDYDEYDPEGWTAQRASYSTGPGLAKFASTFSASEWYKDGRGNIDESFYTLDDEQLNWRIDLNVWQYPQDKDNEYDNDHQDFDWVPQFPTKKLINELRSKGMVINTGTNPPALDGAYELKPLEAIGQKGYDKYEADGTLNKRLDYDVEHIKLSSQPDGTVMFDMKEFYSKWNKLYAGPYPVAIQGSDGKFTVAFVRKNWNAWWMYIFSGEVDGTTLKNVYGASISLNDDYTTDGFLIFKDSDGVSEAFDWSSTE